jgi:uncharacterized membrane protein
LPENVKRTETAWHHFLAALRKYFLAGVVVVVPIAAAILALIWVFTTIDNILQPALSAIIRWFEPGYSGRITGLGFVVTIVLILVTGVVASDYVGHRMIKYSETFLARVPIFRQIYTAIKQVVDGITGLGMNKAAFRKVVFVEFPLAGMKTIGFVTNEMADPAGNKLYSLFIPTSPTPTTGYYMIATADKVYPTNLTVDEAMKLVISAGIIAPPIVEVGQKEPVTRDLPGEKVHPACLPPSETP